MKQFSMGLEIETTKFKMGQETKSLVSFCETFIKSQYQIEISRISYQIDEDNIILVPEMTQRETGRS